MGKRKLLCTPERQAAFDEAMERIKKATGARTQVQLAEVLDVRQSSISDAKRRCSIPSDWQLKLWRSHKLNPDWVMTGTGGQFIAVQGRAATISLLPSACTAMPRASRRASNSVGGTPASSSVSLPSS